MILALGGVTAVMGVLYALMQHDLKRLLAYHTVENIGIIFIAFGLAIAFRANGMNIAAALALTAGLFHVFNHSVFKSLLFFGAGAVLTATGERDMEHLGGLIHRMPVTALTFLVGSAAISALPPLNGFVSEWLLFQSILVSPQLPQWALKFLVPGVGAMLALSAALASTCFVKAFGITFLGRARRPAAAAAHEVDGFSLTAMLMLASICVVAGVLPGLVVDGLAPAVAQLADARLGRAGRSALVDPDPAGSRAQLLQRPAAAGLYRRVRLGLRHSSSTASPHAGYAGRRPGTAASPSPARSPSTLPAASPSRSAAFSASQCSAPRRRC